MKTKHTFLIFHLAAWGLALLSWVPTVAGQVYAFTNFAGMPGVSGSADGTGSAARFNAPEGVAVDGAGNVYVADSGNSTIRRITPAGVVTTVAGLAGTRGSDDGTGNAALFSWPAGLAVDSGGNVYVADEVNFTIRKVTPAGAVTTLAGLAGNSGSADGTGSAARFFFPEGVAVDGAGNVYVADTDNCTIRQITPAGGVTTLAGLAPGKNEGSADGTGSVARFGLPIGVAVGNRGYLYVGDFDNHTIRQITLAGVVTTLAGSAGSLGSADGSGSAARFYHPWGVAVDGAGNIYVADSLNMTIRQVTPAGDVTTLAGMARSWGNADGIGGAARFNQPRGVAVDGAGNVYVADTENHRISKGVPLAGAWLPQILVQPQSQSVAAGISNVVFSVAAGGGSAPLSYQWFFNNASIAGATATSYTIIDVQSANAGDYTVVVTNLSGAATSQVAVLNVLSPTTPTFPPTLTSEPQSQTVASGAGASFMVTATASAPLSYQWQFNGLNLTDGGQFSGTTSNVVWISSVSAGNAGAYDVVVSSYLGAVTSAVANLALTPPAEALRFAAGTNTGAQSSEVVVPVEVDGFSNLLSFQFSLHWDAAVATFVDVEQFGLGGLGAGSFGTGLTNTGTLTVSWDDLTGFGQALSDGTAVFALRFALIGSPGSASPITLDGTPTRVEAANADLVLVPAQTLAGQVSVVGAATVGISGIVFYYPTNYPPAQPSGEKVAGVPVNLNGGWDTNVLSASDGSYGFAGIAAGRDYGVTLAKPEDDLPANGVSTLDVALIRRHILGLGALDSPYKLLAADVSASGTVSTLDIALIRRLILGLTNTFPAGLWRFVPADYVFADPAEPWGARTSRSYTNLMTYMAGQDHVAIKLGDVNNSWTKAEIGKAESRNLAPDLPAVRFEAGSQVAQPGERVAVPVRVSGFHQATSAQFTLGWDARVLRYAGVGEFGVRGLGEENFGTVLAGSGKLAFSWDDPVGTGLQAADGSPLFTVYFDVIGAAGTVSPVSFADSPTVREATVNFGVHPFVGEDGRVMVAGERPVISCSGDAAKGTFALSVPSVKGRHYILEFSDSLSGANWRALGTVVGDGSVKILRDPTATTQRRFYRVRVEVLND